MTGFRTNLRKLHEAAQQIASARARGAEPVKPLVEMIEARRAIEASAVVLRRANDALDSVLEALRS